MSISFDSKYAYKNAYIFWQLMIFIYCSPKKKELKKCVTHPHLICLNFLVCYLERNKGMQNVYWILFIWIHKVFTKLPHKRVMCTCNFHWWLQYGYLDLTKHRKDVNNDVWIPFQNSMKTLLIDNVALEFESEAC